MPTDLSKEQTETVRLDKKDYEILRLLQADAKLTVREIATRVHLSPTPVHERIKRMENQGVIRQYVTLLDSHLVNKGIKVICYVSLREHTRRAGKIFIDSILKFKEVIECYNVSGEFDFQLKIVAESMASYHTFYVNSLSEIKGIGQTKSVFVMDTIKETHQIL
ncbi:Lrp/AsnC family transcriptional regulator [Chryseolinea soli]|uniref:Lrp/AsnC family transcriptional regulator n=1 Tax=Chryseolinea soli TaxID=2321403 RepID=A0A385SM46_9BACT|nr:Lrp/AsnC family transcriptional regulator [Chryseolinea soli]AYB32833.1 Lrp/AsnC family transcriptional regulator [Chryseolinea soli]